VKRLRVEAVEVKQGHLRIVVDIEMGAMSQEDQVRAVRAAIFDTLEALDQLIPPDPGDPQQEPSN